MSRSHIANTIRLLQLPTEVQRLLAEGKIQAGHGRALLSLGEAEAQRSLALRSAAEDLSVREVEELVRTYLEHPSQDRPARLAAVPEPVASPLAEVEELLSNRLATRVTIQMTKRRGRIVVEFGSADDLERIVSEIVASRPNRAAE
jgi:ParB family transcriptional regulator, chromosome partitioning protein